VDGNGGARGHRHGASGPAPGCAGPAPWCVGPPPGCTAATAASVCRRTPSPAQYGETAAVSGHRRIVRPIAEAQYPQALPVTLHQGTPPPRDNPGGRFHARASIGRLAPAPAGNHLFCSTPAGGRETGDGRRETGDVLRETCGGRRAAGDVRRETCGGRRTAGVLRREYSCGG
jgi:hypothetical protein